MDACILNYLFKIYFCWSKRGYPYCLRRSLFASNVSKFIIIIQVTRIRIQIGFRNFRNAQHNCWRQINGNESYFDKYSSSRISFISNTIDDTFCVYVIFLTLFFFFFLKLYSQLVTLCVYFSAALRKQFYNLFNLFIFFIFILTRVLIANIQRVYSIDCFKGHSIFTDEPNQWNVLIPGGFILWVRKMFMGLLTKTSFK